jgi:hypothetical protein
MKFSLAILNSLQITDILDISPDIQTLSKLVKKKGFFKFHKLSTSKFG